MLDLAFLAVSVLFFLLSFGYVAVCERLMNEVGGAARLHDRIAGEHRHPRLPGAGDGETGEVLT